MRLGFLELAIIIVVVLLLFGGTLIPKLFKNGKESIKIAKKEFEEAKEEMKDEFKKEEATEEK